MIFDILKKYNIDVSKSWMIGDAFSDIACGQKANLHTAFIGPFKCDTCIMLDHQKPELICRNLDHFAELISVLGE